MTSLFPLFQASQTLEANSVRDNPFYYHTQEHELRSMHLKDLEMLSFLALKEQYLKTFLAIWNVSLL